MTQSDDPFFVSPSFPDVPRDCPLCPRLSAFRNEHRKVQSDWHNAPVPSFGDADGRLLIVGLAPGLQGANRTGRPFTGDYAGDLLYSTLDLFGFSTGQFQARPDDGLKLSNCLITNAVRCVPPENKPTPEEIRLCRSYLEATINAMPHLRAIVALGRVSHDSVVRALGLPLKAAPFKHGAIHELSGSPGQPVTLFDSYHCSRYNTNTGVLTPEMFRQVFGRVREYLDSR
ncbi:MAG: uracil-DNA glycosylase [Beijerinckiaceae bacterium]